MQNYPQIDRFQLDMDCHLRIGCDIIHSFIDHIMEGLYRTSPENGLVFANGPMVKMFGYDTVEEFKSIDPMHCYAVPLDRIRLKEKLEKQGSIKEERVLYRRKDNSCFWGKLTCELVTINQNVFYDGVIVNVDDIVKKEKQFIEKSNALEKVNSELDRLLYSTSHDLRSPVASLMGLVNLVSAENIEKIKEHDYLFKFNECLHRMNDTIDQLTDFSKNSRQLPKSEPIDFNQMIKNVWDELSSHENQSKIKLSVNVNNYNFSLYSDPFRLHLILLNILKNSLDFMDFNKPEPYISVYIDQYEESTQVNILDNGVGIPKSHVGRVFEMFLKASNLSRGSGLGLYVVREAVSKLKGAIQLTSEYALGTSIQINIPNDIKGKLINRKSQLATS